MVNVLLTIGFVILICVINILFAIFILPKIIKFVDTVIKGELFLSVFEFFVASFSILMMTSLLIYILYQLV